MSEEKTIFEKNDFKNVCFYYFLPFYNYVKKNEIGEKINQFNGVKYYFNKKIFYQLQTISFTLKENIYILIEKETDILTSSFQNEILASGKVSLYIDNKFIIIDCINKEINNPIKYNCILLNGKKIFIYLFI